ncbi:MAG: VIT domain-containing protein [Kiritimatiellia bacterium]
MIAWNPAALDLFRRHCESRRAALLATGADPDEVFGDWQALVEAHAAAAGETEIGADRAQRELIDLLAAEGGLADPDPGPAAAGPVFRGRSFRAGFSGFRTALLWLFGVALPLGVLLFEMLAGFCAEALFDPVPTGLHALLIALVPLANAWALLAARPQNPPERQFRIAGRLNGLALGISAYYALQFAIVTPFAFIALIYFGIGAIPLAPLFSFLTAAALRARLVHAGLRRPYLWPCTGPNVPVRPVTPWYKTALPAFVLLVLLSLPRLAVQIGIEPANDPDPAVRARAVRFLRAFGSRDLLLRKCYRRGENIDLTSLLIQRLGGALPTPASAQKAYYRVTGTPYDAMPPPRLKGLRGQELIDSEWFDPALGGDQVAARIRGLALTQSRLDGRVDSASGCAYLEWTLEFHNASKTEREARALIELPPGAVVSRVTLWINGEPCEAAFGGRSQTRQAYQQVAVRQRRDPVLVTTAGPDRVLLQCFPVPVDGSMKTRIGITAPLLVPDAGKSEAALRLPAFAERNFGGAPKLQTSVWLESDRPALSASAGLQVSAADGPAAIRGQIPADGFAPAASLRVPLAQPYPPVLSRDDRLPADTAILQTLERPAAEPAFPPALAIVVDGSARMEKHAEFLAERVFGQIPPETAVRTFLARDLPEIFDGKPTALLRFAGGCDNGAALVAAAEWSAANGYAPILWLHAAQPLESAELEALGQLADFSRGRLAIHSHQFGPGANRIAEKLADLRLIRPLPVRPAEPLEIADFLQNKAARWRRESVSGAAVPADVPAGSTHVARLWAADEIARLAAPARKTGRAEAVELAQTFQLVTPVSGAVVLETAAQYKAHELTPADPASTPGIVPEPATGLLLLAGGTFLLAVRRRFFPK